MSARQTLLQCLAAGTSTLVIVLSWVPDSRMGRLPLVPKWLGTWLDQGGEMATLRTGLAMAVAAGLIHLASPAGTRRRSAAVAAAILLLAEAGQLFLRSRQASAGDLTWGLVGVVVGVWCAARFLGSREGRGERESEGAAAQDVGAG